jgi:hypothetical protein
MATVLERLETLVKEVIAVLRENSLFFGRVESVLVRVETLLSAIESEKSRANDLAAADTQSVVATRAAWRDALQVVLGWTQTRTAAIFATAAANLVLAWFAHWAGVPLPFLPAEAPAEAPVSRPLQPAPTEGTHGQSFPPTDDAPPGAHDHDGG